MLQINYLAFNPHRVEFSIWALSFLENIKPINKEKIRLVLFTSYENDKLNAAIQKLQNSNINCHIFQSINTQCDYMNKINIAINFDCEFSCKMDEDVMISSNSWDFIIENLNNALDYDKNLFLAPLINNGIPSVEFFINSFCSEIQKNTLQNIFLKTTIPDLWGADYSSLNITIKSLNEWNPQSYYNDVKKIKHFYKGIHPVRVSFEAQNYLAKICIDGLPKIISNNNFNLITTKRPYFCNSFFFIKTNKWKSIISDKSLFRDLFDEVPLNLYCEQHDLNQVFVDGAYCIHMAYNTLSNFKELENLYYEKIKQQN